MIQKFRPSLLFIAGFSSFLPKENKHGDKLNKYDWTHLNHLQLGKHAEYFVKMEFTLYGFDIYTPEVDDRGIDFLIRKDETNYYDVEVKSIRNLNYIFILKDKF